MTILSFCLCNNPQPLCIFKCKSDFQPYQSLLQTKCKTMKDLQKIHAQLIKTGLLAKDTMAANAVLSFCATTDINYAYLVFSQIQQPNLFSWNTIIRGFSQSSKPQIAISLFIHMLITSPIQPQRLTYPSLFKAYSQLGLAHQGAQLHGRVIKLGLEFDRFIRNTIINMYANCGFLIQASKLFDEDLDVVACNSMMMGLAKCGEIEKARELFDKIPLTAAAARNTVSWNTIISGYVRNGKSTEALELFHKMQKEKVKPDKFTLVSLLNASAHLGALKQGEWLHEYTKRNNIELNVILVTALVDMYCKCGSIEKALQVFQEEEQVVLRGLSCWNSMIMGLAMNGFQSKAIDLFSRLESSSSSSNLRPDDVSFIGVLMACNHSGLVDKAKKYFHVMIDKYKIQPSIKHYGCMVDVLGRAGHLKEAQDLIRSMPAKADAITWGSLLSACRNHGNTEMGRWAASHLLELEPEESCGYVIMSNAYAASCYFEDAIKERVLMKEKNVEKQPGCSSIQVNGEVHEFVADGAFHHPQHQQIRSLLYDLNN